VTVERRGAGSSGDPREDSNERGVYIISVAAEIVGVHPQTLRIYERKGLLQPSRTAGNTRRYSERDIARLQTIQRLTQEGVNLAGVKMIVEMENELDRLRLRMAVMREEMVRAERRIVEEVERIRREHRAEIVPLSEMDRLRRRLGGDDIGRATDGTIARTKEETRERPGRRRPIAAGPGRPSRGPIVMGPGS
jgi:MerR family transcriptional regulator/heat shock protein HspR